MLKQGFLHLNKTKTLVSAREIMAERVLKRK